MAGFFWLVYCYYQSLRVQSHHSWCQSSLRITFGLQAKSVWSIWDPHRPTSSSTFLIEAQFSFQTSHSLCRDMSCCSQGSNLLLWMCPQGRELFYFLCTWGLGHSHVMWGSLVRSYETFKCCLAHGQVLFPMKRKQWLDYVGCSLVLHGIWSR